MKSLIHTINNTCNIHARTASELAKIAKDGKSTVLIKKGKIIKDIKKIIGIMQMKLKFGDKITIIIEGEDEEKTAENIKKYLKENF